MKLTNQIFVRLADQLNANIPGSMQVVDSLSGELSDYVWEGLPDTVFNELVDLLFNNLKYKANK